MLTRQNVTRRSFLKVNEAHRTLQLIPLRPLLWRRLQRHCFERANHVRIRGCIKVASIELRDVNVWKSCTSHQDSTAANAAAVDSNATL